MKRITFGLVLGLLALTGLVLNSGAQAATPCADLVVDSVTSVPAQPVMGQPSTIAVTVRNAGTCAAGGFGVQWRPDLLAAALPDGPASPVSTRRVDGRQRPVHLPAHRGLPQLRDGRRDERRRRDERGEQPRSRRSSRRRLGVDLVVSSVSIVPATPDRGPAGVTVSVTVANQGANPAGAFRVDWSPTVGAPAIPRRSPGSPAGASTTVTIPVRLRGRRHLRRASRPSTPGAPSRRRTSSTTSKTQGGHGDPAPARPRDHERDHRPASRPSPTALVTATVTIRNVGLIPAGSFTVRWQPWLLGQPGHDAGRAASLPARRRP